MLFYLNFFLFEFFGVDGVVNLCFGVFGGKVVMFFLYFVFCFFWERDDGVICEFFFGLFVCNVGEYVG